MSKFDPVTTQPPSALLAGSGDVRALMRACNWDETPLGAPETWSSSLTAIVRVMLTSRFAMWMAWGPELTFLCNDAYLPTVGLKRDWVIGSRSDKVWAEIWPDIGPRINHVLRTGEATWDEALLLYLERNGFPEESYHTFSYSPLADDAGATTGMLCVVAEVTERVIGERQLATLRDLGSRLAAASTRAEVMTGLQDCLRADPRDIPFALAYFTDRTAGTARLASLHGLARTVPEAAPHIDLADPHAPWPLRQADEAPALISVPPNIVGDLPLQCWQVPPEQALISPIGAEGGTPVGYFVAGLNPHRAVDAGYRAFIELLTAQVAAAIVRADEYERERERAEALAEIDRTKTAFFSNVSHEFRTPLTLMLGPLEDALADPALPAPQREQVEVAHRNALRLLRLVNSLLDFSRIEADRMQVSFRPTDLASLTAELASSFRSATDRAGLTLIVDTPPLSEPAYIDPDMWEKIVLNLLSNAFKFTLAGEIAVALRERGGQAILTVRDTGTGVPAAELPKLFDRFHRVEGAQGRSFEGSGIGLALVQELVRQHAGSIAVESELGQGTTFTITLPLGRAHLSPERIEPAAGDPAGAIRTQSFVEEALRWLPGDDPSEALLEPAAAQDVAPAPAGLAPPGPRRILLADDNADLRRYIARLLAEAGYTVETAADGQAALASLRRLRPDLLVTDVMMPHLDGFGLLRAIRDDPELRDLPVIVLSARAGEEAKVQGLDSGADDYLTKPFSARELLARVAANISMARLRRETADAIAATEARAARVLAGMTEGYVLYDRDFRVLEINDEALRMDQRTRDEIVGRHLWEAWPGVERADHQAVYERVLKTQQPESLERQGTWVDGRTGWFEVNAYPVPDGVAVFFRDITERKRADQRLQELNTTLEARVEERTRELVFAEDALRQAQKMEAVGRLTGGIAHDFNNLLQGVAGSLDLIRRRPEDVERVRRWAEAGLTAAERGARLTGQLLAFSRAQKLALRPVALTKLVAGFREMLDRTIGSTVRVRLDLETDNLFVLGDEVQLEMAILNLAINARDAMPEGGELTIRSLPRHLRGDQELPDGDYIELTVSDTGKGMPPDVLSRAFDPFFTTKRVGEGTGLGLSQVYGTVRQAGGAVRIESEVGLGTTVRLFLQRTEPVAAEAEIAAPAACPASQRASVLVVDDDPDVRRFLVDSLETLGFYPLEAEDGAAALAAIAKRRPDVIILDFAMPGLNGAEVARRVHETASDVPIIFATGFSESAAIEAAAGPDASVLRKPFRVDELQTALSEALKGGPFPS